MLAEVPSPIMYHKAGGAPNRSRESAQTGGWVFCERSIATRPIVDALAIEAAVGSHPRLPARSVAVSRDYTLDAVGRSPSRPGMDTLAGPAARCPLVGRRAGVARQAPPVARRGRD